MNSSQCYKEHRCKKLHPSQKKKEREGEKTRDGVCVVSIFDSGGPFISALSQANHAGLTA